MKFKKFNKSNKSKPTNNLLNRTKAKFAIRKAHRKGYLSTNQLKNIDKTLNIKHTGKITAEHLTKAPKLGKAYVNQSKAQNLDALQTQLNQSIIKGDIDKVNRITELIDPSVKDKRLRNERTSQFWNKNASSIAKASAISAVGAPLAAKISEDQHERDQRQFEVLQQIGEL